MEVDSDRDRRRRDRKSMRRTNGSLAAAGGALDDDDASVLSAGCVVGGAWRVGAKIGEGTFSRIYAATPVQHTEAIHGPVVLKVNKCAPDEAATTAAAAGAAAGPSTPATPAPKSDSSFAHEAQVFRAVCDAEEKSAGRQARGTILPLSVPRLYEHNAHAVPQMPAASGSAPWTPSPDAVEYMVLEQCGVDLSKLRYDWQSRGQQPAAAVQLIDLCLHALERFHKVGFVHRDIKPSNFLTCKNQAEAAHRVMITDFGLSRRTGGTAAAAAAASPTPPAANSDADNKFVGKSLYASFAAHRQEVQTPRDDVISLLFVMLDLMYGDLPWKDMSKERADISKQRRWEEVLAAKERFLGPAVCEQAAQALAHPGDASFPLPDATWLRDYSLPPLIRRIFYQLHSMPAGAPVNYASLHVQLSQLQMDVQSQMQGRAVCTLVDILMQYAKTAEKEAELERKRQQDEADERARVAQQMQLIAQKEEENRAKERALAEYRAQHEARNAQLKAVAAAAQQQAEEVAAARAQEEARLKSIAAAEQQRLQREREALAKDAHRKKQVEGDAADAKARRPTAFPMWSKRLRDLFADVLHLPRSNLNVIDESSWSQASTEPSITAPSACSLETLWKQVDWAEAAAAAATGKPLLGVKFAVWGGDWYRLTKPPESKISSASLSASTGPKVLDSRSLVMEALSWPQLQGLKAYCDASTSLPKLDRSRMHDDSYWRERDPLRIIAVTVASLYDLAQQAIKGQIKISGFVPVVDKPTALPSLAGTASGALTSLKKILTKKGDAETEAARAAAKTAAGRISPSPSVEALSKLKSLQIKPKQEIKSEPKVKSESKIPEPKKIPPPSKDRKSLSDSSSSDSDDDSGDEMLVPASKPAATPKLPVKKPVASTSAGVLSESDAKAAKAAKRAAKEERRLKKAEKKAAKKEKKATATKEKSKKRLSREHDDDDMSAEDDEAEESAAARRGDSDEDDSGSGDEAGRLVTKSKRQIELSEKQALIGAEQAVAIRAALAASITRFGVSRSEFTLPDEFTKPTKANPSGNAVPTYPDDPVDPSLLHAKRYSNQNLSEPVSTPRASKKQRKDEEDSEEEEDEEEDDASSTAPSVAASVTKLPKVLTEAQKKTAAKDAALAAGPPRWLRRSTHSTLPADTLDVVIVLDPKKFKSHRDPMADAAPVKTDQVEEHETEDAAAPAIGAAATPTNKTAAAAAAVASVPAAAPPSPASLAGRKRKGSISSSADPAAEAAASEAAADAADTTSKAGGGKKQKTKSGKSEKDDESFQA